MNWIDLLAALAISLIVVGSRDPKPDMVIVGLLTLIAALGLGIAL